MSTGSVGPRESTLVQKLLTFMLSQRMPDPVIGDAAYDSDKLDEQLAAQGV